MLSQSRSKFLHVIDATADAELPDPGIHAIGLPIRIRKISEAGKTPLVTPRIQDPESVFIVSDQEESVPSLRCVGRIETD